MKFRNLICVVALILFAAVPSALASMIWYVNGVSGSNSNNCKSSTTACQTIGQAISLAASGDSIMVAPATYYENLTISKSLTIVGSGAATTIINGGRGSRTVVAISTTVVTLSGFTIQYGLASLGGGINNGGTLTINKCTLSQNRAFHSASGVGYGGGIYNNGTLTINNSTLSGNRADKSGGGIYNNGARTLTINNSTLSGNNAVSPTFTAGWGGGIYNQGTSAINNSTLSGNSAFISGGGILNGGTLSMNNGTLSGNSARTSAGGIYNARTATLQNSIVANNSPSGQNCRGTMTSTMTSHGFNMSSDGSCNFHNSGDRNNTNPKLGTLGNNGGPTQTIPLLSGSPAIDAGNPKGCTDGAGHLLTTDQRGMPRHDPEDAGGCDMGAYERQSD
jgi:hypothetical protein